MVSSRPGSDQVKADFYQDLAKIGSKIGQYLIDFYKNRVKIGRFLRGFWPFLARSWLKLARYWSDLTRSGQGLTRRKPPPPLGNQFGARPLPSADLQIPPRLDQNHKFYK